MPEVVRAGKYVVVISPDDHAPAHVHVKFGRCQVRVFIAPDSVKLGKDFGDPKAQEIRRARALVIEHLGACVAMWEEIHGQI